jgi:PPM family protein phosphatase
MPLTLAWKTDPGLQREENEDSVLVSEGEAGVDGLLIVCDGMGGHAAGREASSIAIETMSRRLAEDGGEGATRERLLDAFEAANLAVLESARRVPEWAGMGSTMTAVLIAGDHLALLNVGDSPAYVIREGEVFPIFQDHSWPAEQFRAGLIDAWQVKDHPFKHRLTRAVGVWEDVMPYTAEIDLEDGDLIVLASDGIETAGVEVEVVRDHVARDDLDSAVGELVELCRQYGAPDNVTIAVARYAKPEAVAVAAPAKEPALDRVSKKKRSTRRR